MSTELRRGDVYLREEYVNYSNYDGRKVRKITFYVVFLRMHKTPGSPWDKTVFFFKQLHSYDGDGRRVIWVSSDRFPVYSRPLGEPLRDGEAEFITYKLIKHGST